MGLRKGSSEKRIMFDHGHERHVIHERNDQILRAQPRRFIAAPAINAGKWTGADLKKLRAARGVGRPVNRKP